MEATDVKPSFGFATALEFIVDEKKRVGRRDWKNAKYVFLVAGSEFEVNRAPLNEFFPEGTKVTYRPHIDMVGADGSVGTWAPSMVDLLAKDWYVILDDQDKA